MRAQEYIDDLAAKGQYHFSITEARAVLRGDVRSQLRNLKAKGMLAEPVRGFLVILPAEYRYLGCLPAEQFVPQLLKSQNEPYYFCLLSAAERHGAAHQRPQKTQVMVRASRESIECGKVRVEFIARADFAVMPVDVSNTPRGTARYSTPEVTALELAGYPHHAGGLNNVATVLAELAEGLDGQKLAVAASLSPLSWSQRLGYLLDLVSVDRRQTASLRAFVAEKATSYIALLRAASRRGQRNAEWKLIVNVEVEPDL